MCEPDSFFSEYEYLADCFIKNSNKGISIIFDALVHNKCTSLQELLTII
jgi:hypothetical protein